MIKYFCILLLLIFINLTVKESFETKSDEWKMACDNTYKCNEAELSKNDPKWVTQMGVDYSGYDIKHHLDMFDTQCVRECASTSGCAGIVTSPSNDCWLKSSLKNPTKNENRNLLVPAWEETLGMNYYGNDIAQYSNYTADQCKTACSETSGCVGALSAKNAYNNTCWLKGGITKFPGADQNLSFYTPTGTLPPPPKWDKVSGMDFYGNDLSYYSNYSPEQCKDACSKTTGCVGALSGNEIYSKSCWLKNKINPYPSPNQNTDFYTPEGTVFPTPPKWTEIKGMDFYGHDLKSFSNYTPDQCKEACSKTSGCVGALSGNQNYGNACWLKKGIQPTPNPNGNINFNVPEGSIKITSGDNSYDKVMGWSGAHINPGTTNQTEESCRAAAAAEPNKYSAWGFRNNTHPNAEWKNTCFLYTSPFSPFNGWNSDTVHTTGCPRLGEKVSNGCAPVRDQYSLK